MEKPVEEYIRATFSFLRILKESERSRTVLAAKEDGKLLVVREIYATGLPYKEIKAIEHPLFAKIFLTAEEDGRTWVVEEYIDGESLQELWERGERFSRRKSRRCFEKCQRGLPHSIARALCTGTSSPRTSCAKADACVSSTSMPRGSCAKTLRPIRAISARLATRRPNSTATVRRMGEATSTRSA